jgi:cyclopropane fatty-acyl-phospholipid synthase-like methyltransferase
MTDEVTAFYDEFMGKTMARYRLQGNERIEAAIELVRDHVKPGAIVADVGCGIGMVSEAIARHERSATVIGLDLSPNNIAYAQETISEPNVRFLSSSVTEQFDALAQAAKAPVDLFCMIDVLEHIPEAERAQLFADLARIAAEDAVFVLTYPSPEFQRYRTEHDPAILQIIDNVIEFDDLYREFRSSGWHLAAMRYQGIWFEHEYIYLVLRRQVPDQFAKIERPIRRTLVDIKNRALRPYKRWKYEKAAVRVQDGR